MAVALRRFCSSEPEADAFSPAPCPPAVTGMLSGQLGTLLPPRSPGCRCPVQQAQEGGQAPPYPFPKVTMSSK